MSADIYRFPCIRERQVLTTGGKRFAELANLTGLKATLSAALKSETDCPKGDVEVTCKG